MAIAHPLVVDRVGLLEPMVESGRMVFFGPVLDGSGSWGLGVIEGDDEEEIRAFADGDRVITSDTADTEVGKLLAGYVRSTG
jgi:uncharacterized protein YciI